MSCAGSFPCRAVDVPGCAVDPSYRAVVDGPGGLMFLFPHGGNAELLPLRVTIRHVARSLKLLAGVVGAEGRVAVVRGRAEALLLLRDPLSQA